MPVGSLHWCLETWYYSLAKFFFGGVASYGLFSLRIAKIVLHILRATAPMAVIIPYPTQDNKFSCGALVTNTANSLYEEDNDVRDGFIFYESF